MPLHGTYNAYAEKNGMYKIGKEQWIDENDADNVVLSATHTTNKLSK